MNVSCPQCSTVYRVDPAKVPAGGVRARCSACAGTIPVGITVPPAPRETPADAMADAFADGRSLPGPFASPVKRSTPASPVPAASQSLSGRRPINPFLARDPGLRAKRLARALVSDMVAYYPAKHAEGLEKGNLKELFRDEIKKSYDEYVAQVGADFAHSTAHFQESLNEVLGAGRKIF